VRISGRKRSALPPFPIITRSSPALPWQGFAIDMPAGILVRAACLVAIIAGAILIEGCGTASPRFGSGKRSAAEPPRQTGPRFSSKEAEEESRENDRKPAPQEIDAIAQGKRSFREQKNPAIPPLDESKLMRAISQYMGVPYVHGGASERGMDCSGYTMAVYQQGAAVALPRTSAGQAEVGIPVAANDLKFGDLLFFNTTGASASHVGIYLGDNLFAHASVTLGVTISSLQSTYYKSRYEFTRRVIGGS